MGLVSAVQILQYCCIFSRFISLYGLCEYGLAGPSVFDYRLSVEYPAAFEAYYCRISEDLRCDVLRNRRSGVFRESYDAEHNVVAVGPYVGYRSLAVFSAPESESGIAFRCDGADVRIWEKYTVYIIAGIVECDLRVI